MKRIVTYLRQFPASFWVLCLGWFVSAFGFGVSIPFVSIYFHSTLGLSMAGIGLFFGFLAVAGGWSFGPMVGGIILDSLGEVHVLAWSLIGSLALVSAAGYALFSRRLPARYDRPGDDPETVGSGPPGGADERRQSESPETQPAGKKSGRLSTASVDDGGVSQ